MKHHEVSRLARTFLLMRTNDVTAVGCSHVLSGFCHSDTKQPRWPEERKNRDGLGGMYTMAVGSNLTSAGELKISSEIFGQI